VEAQPDASHVLAMAPFGFLFGIAPEGTKPFRVAGREKEVKWKARLVERQKWRTVRRGRTALERDNPKRKLLVDHSFDKVADDGQLEHLVAVSLIH
jgi:hypothetical protein